MPDCRSHKDARNVVAAARGALRDRRVLGVAMLLLCRAGQALAGDPTILTVPERPLSIDLRPITSLSPLAVGPLYPTPLVAASASFPLPDLTEPKNYSNKDFRPRGRSVYEVDPRGGSAEDNLAFDKTIWQRLSEYRTRDRVRVLTLWESGVSAVSLQTDRKGAPWLQFTSKLNNRGIASHGLLDRLLPVTTFTGNGGRGIVRSAGPVSASKGPASFGSMHLNGSNAP